MQERVFRFRCYVRVSRLGKRATFDFVVGNVVVMQLITVQEAGMLELQQLQQWQQWH